MTVDAKTGLHIAIIGGGITGVILALALEKRGVSYTMYERAPAFTETGAGIGFSPNAERALKVVDPRVYEVYKKVASSTDYEDYFTWVNGKEDNEIVARLLIGIDEFQGGRRSDFLHAWSALIPGARVKFGKEIETMLQKDDGKVALKFRDGGAIGCDGIRSRVRQLILGEANPASYPRYTGKFCYRALIPMDKAKQVLGENRTTNRFMYNGPNAHALTYSVAGGALLNALFVATDPNPWSYERHTAPGTKEEVLELYGEWHPSISGLASLLPEKLEKWAIFDMYDHPAPFYNLGAVAIAGDAAHGSGPHLGSGAGFGIEDGLVLASILKAADEELGSSGASRRSKQQISHDALATYNTIRFDRAQWLPGATREAGELFQWRDKEVGKNHKQFLERVSVLYHTIWDNDIDKMVESAVGAFKTTAPEP
ncbi:hypothetical protein CIB48_g9028 [Xylaria polymorpha]|nr:hypothetical protein CIB48_g9028 [Xylaria polymorpha]